MRTCEKCGCYIPDNWTICPACKAGTEKRKITYPTLTECKLIVYRVDVLYDYERVKTSEYFAQYENALKYATRKANESGILATQIISKGKVTAIIRGDDKIL